ncbi:MAG: ORF6N domain-containing protein [Candidatus Competibacteraceae bacterium]|nr:ORF6N domain-containing protein [Candidatus Competibacteraceae bacterium]MBK7982147.1 ORF6N domain-containing protein [Candidatus Competibacteraceae bacterium]
MCLLVYGGLCGASERMAGPWPVVQTSYSPPPSSLHLMLAASNPSHGVRSMSTQLIRITSEVEIPYLTYQGQAVLTFALIDKVHNRVEGTAKRNFASNRERFISQEDYFYITDSKSLDEFRTSYPGILKDATTAITLITESGYLMLVKSFTDDLSWQIQRQLVKLYFRIKEVMAQAEPERPPRLTAEQQRAIDGLIHRISICCKFRESAGQAAHERVRFAFGLRHSSDLLPEHFDTAKADLEGVKELAEQHHERIVALDREFITAVIRPPVSIRKVRAMAKKQERQPVMF